jgi:hypothetical protein
VDATEEEEEKSETSEMTPNDDSSEKESDWEPEWSKYFMNKTL